MAKSKKKDSKKKAKSKDVLDTAVTSIKKFRRVTRQIGKLSTTQKVFGGVSLLAAGITYLASKKTHDEASASAAPDGAGPAAALPATRPPEAKQPTAAAPKPVSVLRKPKKGKEASSS